MFGVLERPKLDSGCGWKNCMVTVCHGGGDEYERMVTTNPSLHETARSNEYDKLGTWLVVV